jgi:hypothetical protein
MQAVFDGATYNQARDGVRLSSQQQRVLTLMMDGTARTLSEIAKITGDPEASISSRLRDLRKPRFGNYTIERKHVTAGVFTYALKTKEEA